ncbi:MAG: DsbA family protein [Bosea sp. (in: a-proteobacteria)]
MLNRRIVTGAMASAVALPAFAQNPQGDAAMALRLLEPGPLPERVFGDTSAPVTIIEYASLSCGFCAKFHLETWPTLRAKYVETGKVRFIMREFPLDPLAMAGFMLARCNDDKWYEVFDALYREKEQWAHARNAANAIVHTLTPLGVTVDNFNACVSKGDLYKSILAIQESGKKFGVSSTPTFFVNGAKHQGALTLAQFDAILEPLLKPK